MRSLDEIKHAFNPVALNQLSEGQKMKMQKISVNFQDLAQDVYEYVPECPDRTRILNLLLEAKFWTIQAITHTKENTNGKKTPSPQNLAEIGKLVGETQEHVKQAREDIGEARKEFKSALEEIEKLKEFNQIVEEHFKKEAK